MTRRMPIEARFWLKTKKADGDACWEWQSSLSHKGYGMLYLPKPTKAHRFSWALHFGPIPDGLCVLHRCDNARCVRPDHLFLGTRAENNADMVAKGRYRHSPTGHPIPELVTIGGTSKTVAEWARKSGIRAATIHKRIRRGEHGVALLAKVHPGHPHRRF